MAKKIEPILRNLHLIYLDSSLLFLHKNRRLSPTIDCKYLPPTKKNYNALQHTTTTSRTTVIQCK